MDKKVLVVLALALVNLAAVAARVMGCSHDGADLSTLRLGERAEDHEQPSPLGQRAVAAGEGRAGGLERHGLVLPTVPVLRGGLDP